MPLIAALCACIAVGSLLYALLNGATPAAQRRLETIVLGRTQSSSTLASDSDDRPSRSVALRAKLRLVMPSSILDKVADFLMAAGITAAPEVVLAIWALVAVCPVALSLVALGGLPAGRGALLPFGLGALCAYLPMFVIRGRVTRRRTKLLLALPDAMDLLTTCVEAGLGIDAAMARVAEKAKAPLAEELRLVLRTMAMGGTRRSALEQLALRCGIKEISSFTTAVIQAEMMGVSLGQVLRVQSEALRVARKQRAEQQAFKAPVKIIVVLVFFIFPSMFIVILGPAALSLMGSGFGGSK